MSLPATRRIVVIGDVMADIVAVLSANLAHGSDTPADISVQWGGSGANVAAWLGSIGAPVSFIGRVGDDLFGTQAIAEFARVKAESNIGVDKSRPTGTCLVLVGPDGERTMVPDPGANSTLRSADLPRDVFESGAHLHLSGYTLLNAHSRPAALAALALAGQRAMTVSVDASSAQPIAMSGPQRFLAWTSGADLLFANLAEAQVLSGREDLWSAATELGAYYPEIVIKLGSGGAVWWRAGVEPVRALAVEVDRIIDTTGAGDAFAAGYIAAESAGADPAGRLQAGCVTAARAITHIGARPPAA